LALKGYGKERLKGKQESLEASSENRHVGCGCDTICQWCLSCTQYCFWFLL